MMNTNLLYLNTDILNVIGEYVKKDNIARMKKEKFKHDLFEYLDKRMKEDRKYCRKNNTYMSRHDTRNQFFYIKFLRKITLLMKLMTKLLLKL